MNPQKSKLRRLRRDLAKLTIFVFLFSWSAPALAVTFYWVGADIDNSWDNPANWSTLGSGIRGGSDTPGAGDIVSFMTTGSTVKISHGRVTVSGIRLGSVWTGSVLVGSGQLTVGTGGIVVGSGRFIGGTTNIACSGSFVQSGGIVEIQSTFLLSGSYTMNRGENDPTFTSTGTLLMDGSRDQVLEFEPGVGTGALTNLTLENSGTGDDDDIIFSGSTLTLSGSLSITTGNLDLETTSGSMIVENNITLASDAEASLVTEDDITVGGNITVGDAATFTVSGGTLTLNGTGDQTVDFDAQPLYNLMINNTGGGTSDDVTVAGGILRLSGALTVTLGNLDLTTNSVAMTLDRGATVADAEQATVTTNSDIIASGSFVTGAAGSWTVTGNPTLTMTGSYQELNVNGARFANLMIDSGSGTRLTGDIRVDGTLTVQTGATVSLGSYSLAATGATILNYNKVNEDTGKLIHTGALFKMTDSSYSTKIDTFNGGDTIYFTLTESDENIDATAKDTLTISVEVYKGDFETVTLTETDNYTGIFTGSIVTSETSPTDKNGTLETSYTRDVDANFSDTQDGLGISDSTTLDVGTDPPTGGGGGAGISGGGGGGGGGDTTTTITSASSTSSVASEESSSSSESSSEEAVSSASSSSESAASHAAAEEDALGGPLSQENGLLRASIEGRDVTMQDIPVSAWFAAYINSLMAKGIVSGYKDLQGQPTGEFGPANPVTYAEIAKMALRAAGISPQDMDPVNESAIGEWSAGYIASMESLRNSIFFNKGLNVNSPATRGAVVQVIMEIFNVPMEKVTRAIYDDVSPETLHSAAIRAATLDGIVSGDDGTRRFRPQDPINRAEVSKIILKAIQKYFAAD